MSATSYNSGEKLVILREQETELIVSGLRPRPTHDSTKLRPDVIDAMLDTRLMQRYGDAWAHYAPDSFGSECEEMGIASAHPVMTTSTAWGLL